MSRLRVENPQPRHQFTPPFADTSFLRKFIAGNRGGGTLTVVRIFPNTESCLRLIRALCVETHETWLEDNRYLNMTFLAEQKKELLRLAA